MKPNPGARALNAIMRDLMETRDGATYIAGRVWESHHTLRLAAITPRGPQCSNFEFKFGARMGKLMHDGRGILLDFTGDASLKTMASEYGDRLKHVSDRAKEQLGLSAVLIRPDGFVVAWASDTEPKEQSIRQAAALWFGSSEMREAA